MLWASWDEGMNGSSSGTATGALSLSSNDGASYGLLDVSITSGGSTQNASECYAISVDTSTTSTAKGRLVCIDTWAGPFIFRRVQCWDALQSRSSMLILNPCASHGLALDAAFIKDDNHTALIIKALTGVMDT
jgi:hypothetical protein